MAVRFFKNLVKELPAYLLMPYQMIVQVIFSAMFAVIFLNLYVPFSQTSWFEMRDMETFFYTAGFIFLALLILIFSRVLLNSIKKQVRVTVLFYIIWCFIDILLIAGIYTWVTVDIIQPELTVGVIWRNALLKTLLALGIPYLISSMYFTIVDKNNTIRLMNYSNVVSDETIYPDEQKITLFDNNGALKLSVNSSNLYYIESDDNYIKVWYTDSKGELQQYMLRCRLKTVEESFKDSMLVRCHRKYIVNMQKVAVLRKESDGYCLDLDNELIAPLPVSKTYTDNVLQEFSNERPLLEQIDY